MKILLYMLLLLFLWSCNSNKISLTATKRQSEKVNILDSLGNVKGQKIILVNSDKVFEHQIEMTNKSRNQIDFSVQGWYNSGGLGPRILGKPVIEKIVKDDELIVNYNIYIKSIAGKESALVTGYNYQINDKLRVDKNVKKVTFRLIEYKNSRQSQSNNTEKLMDEKTYILD